MHDKECCNAALCSWNFVHHKIRPINMQLNVRSGDYPEVKYSAVQCGAVQCSAVHRSAVQYSAVLFIRSNLHYSEVQCRLPEVCVHCKVHIVGYFLMIKPGLFRLGLLTTPNLLQHLVYSLQFRCSRGCPINTFVIDSLSE